MNKSELPWPASVIRPANTETREVTSEYSEFITPGTCSSINIAVMFRLIFLSERLLTIGWVKTVLALVIVILMFTFLPHTVGFFVFKK